MVSSALTSIVTTPITAGAQARTLSWPEIQVVAHLDADGQLQVRERQVMRFSGAWNGGERRFDVQFGQRFSFERLVRVDSLTGSAVPMVEGDVDQVDHFEWFEGQTLRWRSRLPDAPPFAETLLTYELSFSYRDILEPDGEGRYRLSHDFAFSDREGDIDRFTLVLTVDSAWRPDAGFTGRYDATTLTPGNGFVVTVPLVRIASTPPAAVRTGAAASVRLLILGGVIGGLAVILLGLLRHDARLGRFTPLLSSEAITPEWLEREVFAHLPEVVGAAWDDSTSQPEVAATLARLVQDGKLSSRVTTEKILVFRRHVLHLELKVKRNVLQPHERALIDALFASHETTTDTDRVRARYKRSGFDPASVIRGPLAGMVASLAPSVRQSQKARRLFTLGLFVTAIALVTMGIVRSPFDGAVAAAAIAISIPMYLVARVAAASWKGSVSGYWVAGAIFSVVLFAMIGAFARNLLLADPYRTGAFTLAGLAVWVLVLANSVANGARSTQSPERLAKRRQLAAARRYFQAELAKPEPQLKDAWYPYMLAFGLGSHVDRWFKSFGAATSTRSSSMGTVGSSSSSSGGSSFTGFGGGGGFSGAGGGASFGAALGSMAAAVPAPSSSSSGGGSSSSGGSSGGGGGGGW
jgi:uncharacterized membrane protein YgcG